MSIKHDFEEAMYDQDNEQYEYEKRVYYWYTQFKGSWTPVNNFDPYGFKATEKEYDEATRPYYRSHDNGKIIGEHRFDTLEEFNEKVLSKLQK